MKKFIITTIVLLSIAFTILGQNATFSLPCLGEQPPGTFNFPVICESIDELLFSFEFYFAYDNDILDSVEIINLHPYLFENGFASNLYYTQNEIFVLWTDGNFAGVQLNPGDSLFTLAFYYNGIGTSEIIFSGTSLSPTFELFNLIFINGCVGSDCICDGFIWTGEEDNNWFNPGNWNAQSIPDHSDEVTIPFEGIINFPVIEGSGAKTLSMTIDQDAFVRIIPGGDLTTFGTLIIDGALEIESDENGGSGSYINNGNIVGNGSFKFSRHITNSSQVDEISGWHYLSSPIQNFSSDSIPDYIVNKWDENAGLWQMIQQTSDCTPANPADTLMNMESWSIKLDEEYVSNCGFGTGPVIEMLGNGTDLQGATYQTLYYFTTGNPWMGWNMIGNPYPCSIDPLEINWPENMNQSLYFWDGNVNTYFAWAGGVGHGNIAPTQAFFINASGNGTFTFDGTERIHANNGGQWLDTEIEDLVILKATAENPAYYDLTYFRRLEGTNAEFDKHWDAYKLIANNTETPQIYSFINNELYSINTKSYWDEQGVAFEAGKSGNYTIDAIETSEFNLLFLEDLYTGNFVDLLIDSYVFNYTIGDMPERFILYFLPTTIGIEKVNDFNIQIWAAENGIFISNPENHYGEINIYNLLGELIIKKEMTSCQAKFQLQSNSNVYIVEVITSSNSIKKKIICN
jgi:hypothetical protein